MNLGSSVIEGGNDADSRDRPKEGKIRSKTIVIRICVELSRAYTQYFKVWTSVYCLPKTNQMAAETVVKAIQ